MEHYFIEKEHKSSDYFEFTWSYAEYNFVFKSCDDIFSKNQVDYGTYVLIKTIHKNVELFGSVLDIGSGYGPIAITLAKLFPNATFDMSDVNKTAVELSAQNAQKNGIKNIKNIINSNAYENIAGKYDFIVSNPPIKVGKKTMYSILFGAYDKLNAGGKLIFVIKKKFGEASLKKDLEKTFSSVEILARDSGYYILQATK